MNNNHITIFHCIILLNITNIISENDYICILNELNKYNFDLTSIKNSESLIYLFIKFNLNNSYMFSFISYLHNYYSNYLQKFKLNYTKLNKHISKTCTAINLNEIVNIKRFINNDLKFLKSFIKIVILEKEKVNLQSKTHNIYNLYLFEQKFEILNRLNQIVKNFDIHFLEYNKIPIHTFDYLNNMRHLELQNYYNNLVDTLIQKLNNILNITNTIIIANLLYKKYTPKKDNICNNNFYDEISQLIIKS